MAHAQLDSLNQKQVACLANTALLYRRVCNGNLGDIEKEIRGGGNKDMNIHAFHHVQMNIHDDVNVFNVAVTVDYTVDGGENQTGTVYFEVDEFGKTSLDYS